MAFSLLVDLSVATWLGIVGACIGSFLNVVAYRLPRRISIVWKPSYCPHCKHPIRMRDNLPVLGWILLKGRCRDCGGPISPRYAIVEAAMGIAFFLLACSLLFGIEMTGMDHSAGLTWDAEDAYVFWSDWPGISWYAHHALLLSLLMCVALFDRDGEPAPLRFAAFSLLAAVVSTVVVINLFVGGLILTGDPIDPGYLDAVWGACAGLFIGAAISIVIRGKPVMNNGVEHATERRGTLFRRAENAIITFTLVGTFLGASSVARIALVTILLAFVLAKLLKLDRNQLTMPLVWTATLVHVIFWPQILELSPW